MTKNMWMICTCLAAVTVLAQVESAYDKTVTDGTFVAPNGDQYSVDGVCHFSEDKLDCWDFKGTRSTELNERVGARLSNGSYGQVSVRYGARALIVLTSTPMASTWSGWSFVSDRSIYLNSMGAGMGAISLPKETRRFDLGITVGGIVPNKVATATLSKTESSSVFGSTWKLAATTPMVPQTNPMNGYDSSGSNPKGPLWQLVFESTGRCEQAIGYGTMVMAFRSDGSPIRFVDAKGTPLSDAKYLELGGMPNGYYPNMATGVKPKAFSATASVQQQLEKATSLSTNINPKYIDQIRFTVSNQYRVKFENVPAYPKE